MKTEVRDRNGDKLAAAQAFIVETIARLDGVDPDKLLDDVCAEVNGSIVGLPGLLKTASARCPHATTSQNLARIAQLSNVGLAKASLEAILPPLERWIEGRNR